MSPQSQPKPDWATLPRPGCENVEFRLLLHRDGLAIANLRFAPTAHIDEHDAPFDIDVVCIDGSGFGRVDGEPFELRAGQTITWPRGKMHVLWTDGAAMETIMVERHTATD